MQPGADLADLAAASGVDNIRVLNAIRVVARADFVPPTGCTSPPMTNRPRSVTTR